MANVTAVKLEGSSPQGVEFVLVVDGDRKLLSLVAINTKTGRLRVRSVEDYTKAESI